MCRRRPGWFDGACDEVGGGSAAVGGTSRGLANTDGYALPYSFLALGEDCNKAFEYAGNGSGEVLNAQVICEIFKISGGGSLTITYDPDDALLLSGIGLVE